MSVWIGDSDGLRAAARPAIADVGRALADAVLWARLPLALTGGLVAALVVMNTLALDSPRATDVAGHTGASVWTVQPDAVPRIAFRLPSLAKVPRTEVVWARQNSDIRETEERLILGEIGGDGPFIIVSGDRSAAANSDPALFVAGARLAAKTGLAIRRFGRADGHVGRFGATETARVTLSSGTGADAAQRDCLAWRAARPGTDGRLIGFTCLPDFERFDTVASECLLPDLDGVGPLSPSKGVAAICSLDRLAAPRSRTAAGPRSRQ